MKTSIRLSQHPRLRIALWIGMGVAIGLWMGSSTTTPPVQAEITEGPRREAFKDGGAMNEAVLRDIAATLKRIETRVERIERNTTPNPPGPAKK